MLKEKGKLREWENERLHKENFYFERTGADDRSSLIGKRSPLPCKLKGKKISRVLFRGAG